MLTTILSVEFDPSGDIYAMAVRPACHESACPNCVPENVLVQRSRRNA